MWCLYCIVECDKNCQLEICCYGRKVPDQCSVADNNDDTGRQMDCNIPSIMVRKLVEDRGIPQVTIYLVTIDSGNPLIKGESLLGWPHLVLRLLQQVGGGDWGFPLSHLDHTCCLSVLLLSVFCKSFSTGYSIWLQICTVLIFWYKSFTNSRRPECIFDIQ